MRLHTADLRVACVRTVKIALVARTEAVKATAGAKTITVVKKRTERLLGMFGFPLHRMYAR